MHEPYSVELPRIRKSVRSAKNNVWPTNLVSLESRGRHEHDRCKVEYILPTWTSKC